MYEKKNIRKWCVSNHTLAFRRSSRKKEEKSYCDDLLIDDLLKSSDAETSRVSDTAQDESEAEAAGPSRSLLAGLRWHSIQSPSSSETSEFHGFTAEEVEKAREKQEKLERKVDKRLHTTFCLEEVDPAILEHGPGK